LNDNGTTESEITKAREWDQKALNVSQEIGDVWHTAGIFIFFLTPLAIKDKAYDQAKAYAQQDFQNDRAVSYPWGISRGLSWLATTVG
jgi:hypothetical protein